MNSEAMRTFPLCPRTGLTTRFRSRTGWQQQHRPDSLSRSTTYRTALWTANLRWSATHFRVARWSKERLCLDSPARWVASSWTATERNCLASVGSWQARRGSLGSPGYSTRASSLRMGYLKPRWRGSVRHSRWRRKTPSCYASPPLGSQNWHWRRWSSVLEAPTTGFPRRSETS